MWNPGAVQGNLAYQFLVCDYAAFSLMPEPSTHFAGKVGRWASRRPHDALAAWVSVIAILIVLGLGVHDRLHPTGLAISGTPSDQAMQETAKRFGDRSEMWVLLDGKSSSVVQVQRRMRTDLDRQRVALVGPA